MAQQPEQRIRLKCRFDNEIHIVVITLATTIADVKKRLGSDFGFDVSMKYEDRDGDFISLTSEHDLTDLFYLEENTVNVIVSEAISLPQLTKGKSSTVSLQPLLAPMSRDWSRTTTSASMSRMSARPERFPSISDPVKGYNENNIRWKRGEMLGQGAFGVVYQGFNIDTGELMAVKQIATDDVSRKEMASLENEINLLRGLRHPNIVRYIGTELTANTLSIFLEYIPGGSLKGLIDKFGQFEEAVARSYTRQLLLGLEYLHRNGIAHRDIKGANCLVANDGVIKLADFGSSKHWRAGDEGGQSGKSGDLKGTPSWMAPEVIQQHGEGINWKKADIWSLACTTLEMTTGKPPWSQFDNSVTILFHLACQETLPDYPSPASTELITFLNICFQRNSANRPDVTSLLLHPFVASNPAGWSQITRPTTMSSLALSTDMNPRRRPQDTRYSTRGSTSNSSEVPPLSARFPLVAPLTARSEATVPLLSARGMPNSARPLSTTSAATMGMMHYNEGITPRSGRPNAEVMTFDDPELLHELANDMSTYQSLPGSPTDYLSDFTATEAPMRTGHNMEPIDTMEAMEADSLRGTPIQIAAAPVIKGKAKAKGRTKRVSETRKSMEERKLDDKKSSEDKKHPRRVSHSAKKASASASDVFERKPSAKAENNPNKVNKFYDSDDNSSYWQGEDWDAHSMCAGDDHDDHCPPMTPSAVPYLHLDKQNLVRDWSATSVGTASSSMRGTAPHIGNAHQVLADLPPILTGIGFDYSDVSMSSKQMGTDTWRHINVDGGGSPSQYQMPTQNIDGSLLGIKTPKADTTATQSRVKKGPRQARRGKDKEDLLEISMDSLDTLQIAGKGAAHPLALSGTGNPLRSSLESSKHIERLDRQERQDYIVYDPSERAVTSGPVQPETSLVDVSPMLLDEHTAAITRLRLPAKAGVLISASNDGTVRIWGDTGSRAVLDNNEFHKVSGERRVSLGMGEDMPAQGGQRVCRVADMWAEEDLETVWTGSADHILRVWQGDGRALRALRGHEDALTCVEGIDGNTVSSSGCMVATGSADRTVRMWDLRARKAQVFLFRGHGDAVHCLRWLESGRALVSGSKDKSVRIWDTRAGRLRCAVEKHFGSLQGLRVMPESIGSPTPSSTPACFVSYARDSMLCFYGAGGDVVSCHTAAHRGHLSAVSEVFCGHRPGTASHSNNSLMLSAGAEGVIKLWDVRRMKCLADLPQLANAGLGAINKLAWCRGGFLAATTAGQLKFFQQTATDGESKDFSVHDLPSFSGQPVAGIANTAASTAACTDVVSSHNMVACAAKSGKILRWAF